MKVVPCSQSPERHTTYFETAPLARSIEDSACTGIVDYSCRQRGQNNVCYLDTASESGFYLAYPISLLHDLCHADLRCCYGPLGRSATLGIPSKSTRSFQSLCMSTQRCPPRSIFSGQPTSSERFLATRDTALLCAIQVRGPPVATRVNFWPIMMSSVRGAIGHEKTAMLGHLIPQCKHLRTLKRQ